MIIIIGTGLAGYQLAREFRKLDQSTPLILFTEDDGSFYPKPQLSTALTSKKNSESLATASAKEMALQLNATIRTHTKVTKIDVLQKTVTTNDETVVYDKLVFACGAVVLKAPIQGDAVKEILSINHLYNYVEFEKLIQSKKKIAILGTGLIGCEFANDLSNAGYEVHLIAPDKAPLERFIPAKIGKILQGELENNGVTFHLECMAERIDKANHGYHLKLSNGDVHETELVLSAIGLKPHIELAKEANIQINRGILVNSLLETSITDVYALGDCAEVEGHVLPFITPILNCARALAKTLAGTPTRVAYPAMPVVVKTPAHPIVICPPPMNKRGNWQIEINNNSAKALFYDENQQLYGFVLTNEAVKERANLVKMIPGLF